MFEVDAEVAAWQYQRDEDELVVVEVHEQAAPTALWVHRIAEVVEAEAQFHFETRIAAADLEVVVAVVEDLGEPLLRW